MDMKDQKLATEIAEERMTLIAPLLSQNLDKDSVRLIRSEICERNQISPQDAGTLSVFLPERRI